MAKKTMTTALATNSQFSVKDVPALLERVRSQITEIQGNDDDINLTDGNLGALGNIFHMEDPMLLIQAYSMVTGKEVAYNKAAKDMDLKGKIPVLKLNGATIDKWKVDIQKRYKQVTRKNELDKLQQVKSELEGLLSQEDKVAAALGNIADLLNS